MSYDVLLTREIFDILIGDTKVYENYGLPYLKGSDLCSLSTMFGLSQTYSWSGGNLSRWMYMQELMVFLNKQDRVQDLLLYLFKRERFDFLNDLGSIDKVKDVHSNIIKGTLDSINSHLLNTGKALRLYNGQFSIENISESTKIEMPNFSAISAEYVRELPNRIKEDLKRHDYDSVVTKSRTLLEEVLIYIVEKHTKKQYDSKGDLVKIYQDATSVLCMRQQTEWDKRVNELLGGLHKIIDAISRMRNIGGDAHGAGSKRIRIKEREAILISYSSVIMSEYLLSVFNDTNDKTMVC